MILTQKGTWLIEGNEIMHDVSPRRVDPKEDMRRLENFCATQQAGWLRVPGFGADEMRGRVKQYGRFSGPS